MTGTGITDTADRRPQTHQLQVWVDGVIMARYSYRAGDGDDLYRVRALARARLRQLLQPQQTPATEQP